MLAVVIAAAVPALNAPDPVFVYSTRSDNKVRLVGIDELDERAVVDVKAGCHELLASSDSAWALGSIYGGPGKGHQPADNRLVVIDLTRHTLHRTIDLGTLSRPNDMAFIPGTTEAIVTVEMPPNLVRVDAKSGEFTSIPLDHPAGHMLALSPDAKTAYVAHVMPGLVSVVDLAARKTTATIKTPAGAEGIACSPDGLRLWVACNRADSIVIIDTATHEVVQTIDAPGFPFRLRFSPDGTRVAVSFPKTAELGLFDAADPATVTRVSLKDEPISTPLAPTSVSFSPDGKSVAVVCDGPQPQLVRVDVARKAVAARVATVAVPDALTAATPARSPAGKAS